MVLFGLRAGSVLYCFGGSDVTEYDIQSRIFWRHPSARIIAPNYTPPGWYECDAYIVTPSGYAEEYEIKLSRSDFFADSSKEHGFALPRGGHRYECKGVTKHAHLEHGDPEGPSRFWFVLSRGIVSMDEVPAWAGVVFVEKGVGRLTQERKAPRLHREKVSARTVAHVAKIFCYRYRELRNQRARAM